MQAVILAAGEGQRLGPLTETRPKPMVPVANQPLMEFTLEAAVAAGVTEVVLVVGHRRERIQNHFGDGDEWDVPVEYVVQDHQLGAAHALLEAADAVADEFLVLNGDQCLTAPMIARLRDRWAQTGTPTVTVTRSDDPVEYGAVELDGDRVESVSALPTTETPLLENVGAYAFDRRVFDEIRDVDVEADGDFGMAAALQRLADAGALEAVRYEERLLEVDYLWDLLSVNERLVRSGRGGEAGGAAPDSGAGVVVHGTASVGRNATLLSGTALGRNAHVGPNAVVSNSIVMEGARVGSGAVVHDCIVGSDAVLGSNCTAEGGPADVLVEGRLHEDVTLGGVVGDRARLGGNVTLAPGAVVGVDARVASGSVVEGRIASGETVRRG